MPQLLLCREPPSTARLGAPVLARRPGESVGPQAEQNEPARRLARPRRQPLRPGLAARPQLDGPCSAVAPPGAELDRE